MLKATTNPGSRARAVFYGETARKLRARAQRMHYPEAAREMQLLAGVYERLARYVESAPGAVPSRIQS